mgnify:CR=1 FL=1|jgi:uncharacterized protein YjiS (DUF1127 family)
MKHKILESYIVRFIRYMVDWRRTRAVIRELNMLTDRELKDIGLTRSEITRLAYTREQKNESTDES